jgi:hypothetical protein
LRRATEVVEDILGADPPPVLEESLRAWILGEFSEIEGGNDPQGRSR